MLLLSWIFLGILWKALLFVFFKLVLFFQSLLLLLFPKWNTVMFTGPRREQTSLPISCVRQGRGGRKGGGERRGGRGLVLVGWDAPSARLYQDLSSAAGASVENLYQSPFGPHECYICHHSTYSYMSWFYPLFCFSSAALGLYYTCMFL